MAAVPDQEPVSLGLLPVAMIYLLWQLRLTQRYRQFHSKSYRAHRTRSCKTI
jgi:hypothetical protein